MKSRAMFMLAAAIAATNLQASAGQPAAERTPRWLEVTSDNATALYVDSSSVKAEGEAVTAAVLQTFSKTQYMGEPIYPHRSRVMRYAFDCDSGELGYQAWTLYTGELASGSVVWGDSLDTAGYYKPSASDVHAVLVERVCRIALTELTGNKLASGKWTTPVDEGALYAFSTRLAPLHPAYTHP